MYNIFLIKVKSVYIIHPTQKTINFCFYFSTFLVCLDFSAINSVLNVILIKKRSYKPWLNQ